MRYWLNIYSNPSVMKRPGEQAVNQELVAKGVFPGSAFYTTSAAAEKARKKYESVTGNRDFLRMIEVEIGDA